MCIVLIDVSLYVVEYGDWDSPKVWLPIMHYVDWSIPSNMNVRFWNLPCSMVA